MMSIGGRYESGRASMMPEASTETWWSRSRSGASESERMYQTSPFSSPRVSASCGCVLKCVASFWFE